MVNITTAEFARLVDLVEFGRCEAIKTHGKIDHVDIKITAKTSEEAQYLIMRLKTK